MSRAVACALVLAACAASAPARAYPLDAFPQTGIARLEAYRLAREGKVRARALAKGALWPSAEIRLRLLQRPDFELPPPDAALGAELRRLLGEEAPLYGVALLDLSDPARPRYAEHHGDLLQNPGSVGKILVALAWFQALADLHPEDLEARRRLLRETSVVADGFIRTDHHVVPFWKPGEAAVVQRPLRLGDRANLWTYFDWMCSASSNAAAGMLMAELLLLRHFAGEYPVPPERAARFFAETPKAELGRLLAEALQSPVARSGLDLERLRQGSFFTGEGKRRVPGTSSHATPRELVRYMVRMEQGRLVDPWSSLEIKKLLYLTDRRIRYASSPALSNAAVFFKSGSLYSCRPEPEFVCRKYHGNVRNYMNSITAVETAAEDGGLHYLSAVVSNVLRKNSAVAHQTLATRIHRLIQGRHPKPAAPPPEAP